MAITGIFFGSDTGNTENIAKMIQKQLGKDVADVHDIAKSSKEDLEAYDILLLGIPTWYYGEAQCDWDDFFPTLEEIDFNGKLVAFINTQLFIARKRISFRSSRSTLVREQI